MPIERIRDFVLQQAKNLEETLLGDPGEAKRALRTYLRPLVLSPKQTDDGPSFSVSGTMDLFSGLSDGMLLTVLQLHQDIEWSKEPREKSLGSFFLLFVFVFFLAFVSVGRRGFLL